MPAESTAELRELIATVEADAVRAGSVADDLQDRRRALLLAGDDDALAPVEQALLKAARDRERCRLRLEGLGRLFQAASQAERDAAAERKRRDLADICRARLKAAGRVDAAIAAL